MNGPPPRMVEARRVLLDALDALADHRDSLVLVGAQAVYLRTANVDLSFSASYTTDADLVINPAALGDVPLLADAKRRFRADTAGPSGYLGEVGRRRWTR